MINGDDIIVRQLNIREKTDVVFQDGSKTTLTPVKYIPVIDGDSKVFLDGQWKVCRWPFKKKEEVLVSDRIDDTNWEEVLQPGKVFYADPDAECKPIKNWSRVTLSHIDDNDGAVMRRSVKIPGEWKNRRILLRFDSIYPAGRIYINGELIGEHLSGLTPAEFEVTDKVEPGKTVLIAVRLMRKYRFVKMDMVRHSAEFAGLAQSAYFHSVEPVYVDDYHLATIVSRDFLTGTVKGSISILNSTKKSLSAVLNLKIVHLTSSSISDSLSKSIRLKPGERKEISVSLKVDKPLLWNDEFPNLYRINVTLASKGQRLQCLGYRTGFRRLELSPRGARLNGRFIKFRGVNHLTYHPDYGMYTPEDWLRKNLLLMKKANVNAIRTHFLGPGCLADLCDELGIYLLQELPVDWGTNYIHDPEWVGPALARIQGGVLRDRHHPSVMVWSVGNENMPESKKVADDGWNHLMIYDRFVKTLDPSRVTMFPPPGPANKIKGIFELRVGDIADIHYSFKPVREFLKTGRVQNPNSWEADMVETTKEDALKRGWSGVWFSSEYGIINMLPDVLNGPYLSIIADRVEEPLSGKNTMQVFIDRLREEWGFMRSEPTCLGGAYFPWICPGSGKGTEGNPWGWVRWAEDADWGVVCADLTPKPFFWALRVLFSPVWFPQRVFWREGDREISFQVENQYNSINLKDCKFRIQFAGGRMATARAFKEVVLRCAPGRRCKVKIPVWDKKILNSLKIGQPAVCRCTLIDPKGFRPIAHDILIIPEKEREEKSTVLTIGPDAVL